MPAGRFVLLATLTTLLDFTATGQLVPPIINTVVGNGSSAFGGDGGNPADAAISNPGGVAVDGAGNLFIADTGNHRIRKVTFGSNSTITTVAGNGIEGFSGDGGSPTAASLNAPFAVAVDASGNLYIADTGNDRIRKVTFGPSPVITTVAGGGGEGYCGDEGDPTAACLFAPFGVAVDNSGNLYIADTVNQRIRKVTFGASPVITTFAGDGTSGFRGDRQPVTVARLSYPYGVAVDAEGAVYIGDTNNNRVRRVIPNGVTPEIITIAGNGAEGVGGNRSDATLVPLNGPGGLAVDKYGKLYFADIYNSVISVVTTDLFPTGPRISVVAGQLSDPFGVAVDGSGNLYIADTANSRIRKVSLGPATVTTAVGTFGSRDFCGDGGSPTNACLNGAGGTAFDSEGNLYIADEGNGRIRKVTFGATPTITTVAGNGVRGFCGDGGDPTAACLNGPRDLAIDSSGSLYIADTINNRIRKVTFGATPVITTVAGNGTAGFCGDNGNPLSACLNSPRAVTVDAAGNLYISDTINSRIRKVTFGPVPMITTAVGNGTFDYCGDGGSPESACLNAPLKAAFDNAGGLYITDTNNFRIRKVTFGATPVITTAVGIGVGDFCGDGGPPTSACILPDDLTLDGNGNLYIADYNSGRIRKVTFGSTPVIVTLAGDNNGLQCGDSFAADSCVYGPFGMSVDASGANLYFSDNGLRVRKLGPLQ